MALQVQPGTASPHVALFQSDTCTETGSVLPLSGRGSTVGPDAKSIDFNTTIDQVLSGLRHNKYWPDRRAPPGRAASQMQGPRNQPLRQQREYLPAIAPRKRQATTPTDNSYSQSFTSKAVTNITRTRLPPRSRFGCWTCRTRKVKCDEARPRCNPCTRLGHRCDYNPRLSFKDDTPRVVEKMQHLTGQSSQVWDCLLTRLYDSQLAKLPRSDFLAPFVQLTNDEERERKAEFRPPGSYNVIVTPGSFSELEEYKAHWEDGKPPLTPGSKSSKLSVTAPASPEDGQSRSNNILLTDPDIVILRVFEDTSKKLSSPGSPNSRFGPTSATSNITSPSSAVMYQSMDAFAVPSQETPPSALYELTPQDQRDWPLICHYRSQLSRHLFHVHRGSLIPLLANGAFSTQELFERTVPTFPPLYHALMALCALGISQRSGVKNLDSLQHYQQALPSLQKLLRSTQDLSSDGALLTHFVLLLYEIAAAEPQGSNLWSQHISQLLRIFILRHEMYDTEPYSFLLWWVCNIDTHALLCGTGNGELVEAMLQYNMFPSADNVVQLNGTGECYDPLTEEAHAMPAVLEFNRKIETLTARLGLLARDLRQEYTRFAQQGLKASKSCINERQRRVGELQNALRRTWNEQMPPYIVLGLRNQSLSIRARGIFDNSYVLYRASMIYSHTSMYPAQRLSTSPYLEAHSMYGVTRHFSQNSDEVAQSAREILNLTREIVNSGHRELRFVVFPLFMAGFASHAQDRQQTMELMRSMETESIGKNTEATRDLLEAVYRQQDEADEWRELGLDVDWLAVLGERGIQLI